MEMTSKRQHVWLPVLGWWDLTATPVVGVSDIKKLPVSDADNKPYYFEITLATGDVRKSRRYANQKNAKAKFDLFRRILEVNGYNFIEQATPMKTSDAVDNEDLDL